ncbi:MFS transporter [Methylobacterium nodulans]|uniref:MFS transporter n=1 Tax=Methylobacterium nodulans TaxID=114616 RepID=UPI0005C15CB8|nr:MFS transporter [Methylobacterium nodulans]
MIRPDRVGHGSKSGPGLAALAALQALVTIAPLALLPFLGLHVVTMSGSPAAWTALALAAPAVTTLALTPAWTRLARRFSLSELILGTGALSAVSCGLLALAADPLTLVLGRLVQGATGSGVVLALAFRSLTPQSGRSFTLMQQAVSAGCLVGPIVGGLAFERGQLGTLMLTCGGLILLAAAVAAAACRKRLVEPERGTEPDRRTALPLLGAGMCGSAGAFAFIAFFPAWAIAHDPEIYTPGLIGLLHSLSWLVALAILPLWGRGIDAVAPVAALALSLLGCALAFAAMPLGLSLTAVIALRLLQGALFSGQAPALFAAVEAAGPSRVAAIARARASLTVGQLIGPFAAGLMLGPFGPGGALWAAAGLSLAGAVTLLTVQPRLVRDAWSRAR